MILNSRIAILTLVSAALLSASCEKDAVQDIDSAPTGAFVKVYNFAPSGPSVNFYSNDTKITATSSASGSEATTGVAVGSVFPTNNSYLSLAPGSVTIKTIVPSTASVNPNGVIASIPASLTAGKFYSVFTSGTYDATSKTTSGFVVEDILPAVDTTAAYVRLVNTIANNVNGFDLKAVSTTAPGEVVIATAVAYKSASPFVKVPAGVFNLTSVSTNTPTNYTITRAAVTFAKGFVYTIAARGDATIATGTNARTLDLTRNR
ncbi:MAG TPA: DUF4397 domain-containing protein [Pedobacter sp.]